MLYLRFCDDVIESASDIQCDRPVHSCLFWFVQLVASILIGKYIFYPLSLAPGSVYNHICHAQFLEDPSFMWLEIMLETEPHG